MDANKLSVRINQIRDLHYGSAEQPSLHKLGSSDPCETCDLLSAVDTGRFRLWDPVDNRPLALNSKERVYRSALEALRAFFDIPEGAMMPSNTRHIVAQVLDAALADPPKVVDPMTFTQDFLSRGVVGEDPDLVNDPEPGLPTPIELTEAIKKQLDVDVSITMRRVWKSSGEQRHYEQTVLEIEHSRVLAAVYFKPGAQLVESIGILGEERWEIARNLIEVCEGFGVKVQ